MKFSKPNMKNSLTPEKVAYYDKLLKTEISKESQIAQYLYSTDSPLFNEYYRSTEHKFEKLLNEKELSLKEVKNLIFDLKNSNVITTEDIIVYRGFESVKKVNIELLKKIQGFISTSLDQGIAHGYTRGNGIVISILIPKGIPVMYLRDYSIYPHHLEILIPPDYYIAKSDITESKSKHYIIKKR